MLIGIFGGTFDPIHNGHIGLARHFLSCLSLDEVWFLVSPMNPWKQERKITPDAKRLQQVEAALNKESGMRASDFEFHLDKPSFTYQTLRRLREEYPNHRFVLLIGADNWVKFSNWRNHEEILEHHHIAVYPRDGYPVDYTQAPENVTILPPYLFNVSSTQVRDLLEKGEDVSHLVPQEILELL